MKISNINFNFISNTRSINFKNTKVQNFTALQEDVFQKTATTDTIQKTTKTERTNNVINEKTIQQLYDEVYEEFVLNNPIVKELGLEKPKLKFTNETDSIACYNVYKNSVEINLETIEELIACSYEDKSGNNKFASISSEKMFQQDYMYLKGNYKNIKTYKFNENEKKLYTKSVFVHELRHFIQENVIFSTQGCEDLLKECQDKAKKIIEMTKELIEIFEEEDNQEEVEKNKKELEKIQNECQYILNYKPKKKLPPDFKIKFSLNPQDKRYWSVKKHFYANKKTYNNQSKNYWYGPIEIDAYNHQAEFLKSCLREEKYKNIPNKILEAIMNQPIMYGEILAEEIKDTGFEDFIIE